MSAKYFTHIITILLFCGLSQTLSAQSVLMNNFEISSDGADILLNWELQAEDGITEFRLFRKFNDDPNFVFVSTINVNGTRKYTYLDDNIFKSVSRVIHYELQVVVGNKVEKFQTSISHNPTSIQRTWGSIKSMFR
ncbi:MAG: hypothetical protein AAF206_15645 [Bacteroidota bacterium]